MADIATVAQQVNYSKFTFTEGTDDALNGSLDLGAVGTYNYYVYAQSSTTNLDPDSADELVKRGQMRLIDSTDSTDSYIEHSILVNYYINE